MSAKPMTQILLVEDDLSMAMISKSYLSGLPYEIHHASNGNQAISLLRNTPIDGVLLDLSLPDVDGLEILELIKDKNIPVEVIVTTGDCSMNTAIDAMKLGARDYLIKPFTKERLVTTLKNTFESQQLKRLVETYRDEIDRHQYCGFIGSSLAMQRVYQLIDSAASSKATIFITGESGTGKEVCAEAVHQRSDRQKAPFIALNCGAIPKDLIESEIFGHVKGAFTGAASDREGAAKAAHGGTLFLDEICEMELSLQSKLLRFLQTGTLQKVGSDRTEKVDVRIICATNKNPLHEVELGRFREDLYYRLHVLPIHLPPLRERDDEVMEIARSFLAQYAKEESKSFKRFDPEAELILSNYDWPGNVRQLQNVIRNIVVLCNDESVTRQMLPAPLDTFNLNGKPLIKAPEAHIAPAKPSAVSMEPRQSSEKQKLEELIRPLADLEREAIETAIELCDGNIPTAAHYLGISAATIYRKRVSWKG